jgi:phage shock protein A
MAGEDDNIILRLLRDIRAKLDEHDGRFDEHDKQFAELRQRMDEVHETLYTAAGMAAHANVRQDAVARELADLRSRIEKLEEKVH